MEKGFSVNRLNKIFFLLTLISLSGYLFAFINPVVENSKNKNPVIAHPVRSAIPEITGDF